LAESNGEGLLEISLDFVFVDIYFANQSDSRITFGPDPLIEYYITLIKYDVTFRLVVLTQGEKRKKKKTPVSFFQRLRIISSQE
jgi:hypothetical protein